MQIIVYDYTYEGFLNHIQRYLDQGYRVVPGTISVSINEKMAKGDFHGCFMLFMDNGDIEEKQKRT